MYITITNSRELLRIHPSSVVCIQSDGNYSSFMLSGGVQEVVSMQLGLIEELLKRQLNHEANCFIRIGRSWIINREKVYKIIPSEGVLMLRDGDNKPFQTAQLSTEALKKLKAIMEQGDQK